MSRKKSTSTAAPKKGERLILDRIMNTRDPHMKETYFRLFDEEWERSGYTPHTIPIRERAPCVSPPIVRTPATPAGS